MSPIVLNMAPTAAAAPATVVAHQRGGSGHDRAMRINRSARVSLRRGDAPNRLRRGGLCSPEVHRPCEVSMPRARRHHQMRRRSASHAGRGGCMPCSPDDVILEGRGRRDGRHHGLRMRNASQLCEGMEILQISTLARPGRRNGRRGQRRANIAEPTSDEGVVVASEGRRRSRPDGKKVEDFADPSKVAPPRTRFAIDVLETQAEYSIIADMPGVSEEDVNLSLDGLMLSIIAGDGASADAGQDEDEELNEGEKEDQENISRMLRVERRRRRFRRTFQIPEDVNVDEISASIENGVLEVTLPRVVRESTARTISVTSSKN